MYDSLTTYVPRVKARISPNAPFGVSLRLSASSADTLVNSSAERSKLKSFLSDNDMYLYTVNAFPYGPFKNTRVKEQVFEPDWRDQRRAKYTENVADILADVGAPFLNPSIQSPPLGSKARVTGNDVVQAYAANIRRLAVFLHRLRERTGRTLTLALEPEPFCFLETTAETVSFFTQVLRSDSSIRDLATTLHVDEERAREILKRHIGVVYDICHQAVEFEDVTASLQSLADNEIAIFKLQQAAAVCIPSVTAESVQALKEYADSVYLTQTFESRGGKLNRFLNLEDAFAAFAKDPAGQREWRTHFHVPIFLQDLGKHFKTTRFAIEEALTVHRRNPVSTQLEVETYTWDVLPDDLKTGDIVDYIVRELEWVRERLSS
jgi:sugar phosphate isomerase/epimerase